MSTPTRILLVKSQAAPDPAAPDAFMEAFQAEPRVRAQSLSALQFRYVNQAQLSRHLLRPDYDGLILTSVRAVLSIGQCWPAPPDSSAEHWAGKPIFVVGPRTGQTVRQQLGWPHILGQTAGHADELVRQMLAQSRAGQKFLFPCGQLKGDSLPERLRAAGVQVEVITSYITEENPELRSLLVQAGPPPDWMVFFSPSGLKFTLPVMQSLGWDEQRIQYAALGPTTAQCLRDHGLSVRTTPAQPTPSDLLSCILKYIPI